MTRRTWLTSVLALAASASWLNPLAAHDAAQDAAGYRLAVWPQRRVAPDFSLVDVDGHPRSIRDFQGHVVVVFFGYARCPDVCPAELFKLSLALKKLGSLSGRVQVLFVTLDPTRDTAQILKDYVAAFDPRFIGLTGTATQINQAAAAFFIQYAKMGLGNDYTISHSSRVLVLDAAGRLRLIGTAATSVDDLAHDLAKLAME